MSSKEISSGAGSSESVTATDDGEPKPKRAQREIRGNLPYISGPTYIKRVLDAAVEAERPENFSKNWINTVLNISGGSTGSVPNFLKKLGFVGSDGVPTERYARFKTDSGRAQAAYEGLKQAYSELFAKNEVVHKADESKVIDYIVEITGLTKSDSVVRHIYNSFDSIRQYLPSEFTGNSKPQSAEVAKVALTDVPASQSDTSGYSSHGGLGLSYHINIVLPETDNPVVLDAIFKSIKRNLL